MSDDMRHTLRLAGLIIVGYTLGSPLIFYLAYALDWLGCLISQRSVTIATICADAVPISLQTMVLSGLAAGLVHGGSGVIFAYRDR